MYRKNAEQRRCGGVAQVVVSPVQQPGHVSADERQAIAVHRFGQAEGRVAEAAEGEREADEEEADEAETEDGEVGRHHLGGVLLLGESGLDEREAGLHEDHQDGADDHPEQVGRFTESNDGVDLLGKRLAGDQEGGDGGADEAADDVFECGT